MAVTPYSYMYNYDDDAVEMMKSEKGIPSSSDNSSSHISNNSNSNNRSKKGASKSDKKLDRAEIALNHANREIMAIRFKSTIIVRSYFNSNYSHY